jgi:hypothetical protein
VLRYAVASVAVGSTVCSDAGFVVKSDEILKRKFRLPKMFDNPFGRRVVLIFQLVGRHPTWILVLPSVWVFLRFSPFWKDIDAFHQLLSAAWAGNILHYPPIYCFGARIPFWLADTLISGRAPSIYQEQHPSLAAVLALLVLQHASLWASLRYFLFSVPLSDLHRGIVTLLLASVASFYVFAHTGGSDAMTSVTWFLVFGAGFRVLTGQATWRSWVVYFAALLLAFGSRHINGVLFGWLPLASLVFLGSQWVFPQSNWRLSIRRQARNAALATGACIIVFGTEHCLVAELCQRFKVIEQSTLGTTLSDRIATWVSLLSPGEKDALLVKVRGLTADSNVRLAIESQIYLGPYHSGTDKVIRKALEEEGLPTERIQAESYKVILGAAICFYEAIDLRFVAVILKEFIKGWAPTSDYRVALSGPLETFRFASLIERDPSSWSHLPDLPMFDVSAARRMLRRAEHDWVIRHWEGVPILVWTVLFAVIGIVRFRQRALRLEALLIGLTVLGIGAGAYAATCLTVYSTPRYVLPLLVSVFAFGAIVFSNRDAEGS